MRQTAQQFDGSLRAPHWCGWSRNSRHIDSIEWNFFSFKQQLLIVAGSKRSRSSDTCSPETVHSPGHTPPGSGRAAATPEPSSRRWEPALCPPSAGSRSVGCGSLFGQGTTTKIKYQPCPSLVPAGHKPAAHI